MIFQIMPLENLLLSPSPYLISKWAIKYSNFSEQWEYTACLNFREVILHSGAAEPHFLYFHVM